MSNTIITSTGSYVPEKKVFDKYFSKNAFFNGNAKNLERTDNDIIEKSKEMPCMAKRCHIPDDLAISDKAFRAAENALENTDRESLDYIIVGKNSGDNNTNTTQAGQMPSIAGTVMQKLKIKNPYTVAFDVIFGCPGWLQGMILADYYIKSGAAKKILVIGPEMLSCVSGSCDIDSMIYAEGVGAALVEATDQNTGILSHGSCSDTYKEAFLLQQDVSSTPKRNKSDLYTTMNGHEIYQYAVKTVPELVRQCLNKLGLSLKDVKKIVIQQANQKMGEAILTHLFKLYQEKSIPQDIMPTTISKSGKSPVRTLPTLFDLIGRKDLGSHEVKAGDVAVFASVGSGMNTNAFVYRIP